MDQRVGGLVLKVRVLQKLDLQAETIELADDSTSTAHDLVKVIPHDEPRYSFFNYSRPYPLQLVLTE